MTQQAFGTPLEAFKRRSTERKVCISTQKPIELGV